MTAFLFVVFAGQQVLESSYVSSAVVCTAVLESKFPRYRYRCFTVSGHSLAFGSTVYIFISTCLLNNLTWLLWKTNQFLSLLVLYSQGLCPRWYPWHWIPGQKMIFQSWRLLVAMQQQIRSMRHAYHQMCRSLQLMLQLKNALIG